MARVRQESFVIGRRNPPKLCEPQAGDVHRAPTRPNITGIQINNSLYLSHTRIGLLQWFDWGRAQGARIRDKPGDIYRIAKAAILRCRRMHGCCERRRKERSQKQVVSIPPVLDQQLTRQIPPQTSRIPTPQGGWVGQRTLPKEWGWGLLQPRSRLGGGVPADPGRNRGYATSSVLLSSHPLHLGLTYVNRFAGGLTG